METIKHHHEETDFENNLLKTIRIPKNLLILTDKLPSSNYEKAKIKKSNQSNKLNLEPISKKNYTEGNDMKLPKKIVLTLSNTNTNEINNTDESIHSQQRDHSPKKRIIKDHLVVINEEKKRANAENLGLGSSKNPSNVNVNDSKVYDKGDKNEADKKKGILMLPALKNAYAGDNKQDVSPKKDKLI